jgi:hypothetical protein
VPIFDSLFCAGWWKRFLFFQFVRWSPESHILTSVLPLCHTEKTFFFSPAPLAILGFEPRISHSLDQVLYHLSHTVSHFCSDYFGDRVSFFCPGWPRLQFSYFMLSYQSWDDRCMPPHLAFFFFLIEMRSHKLFAWAALRLQCSPSQSPK